MSEQGSGDPHPPTGRMSTAELLRYRDRLTALKSNLASTVAASRQEIEEDEREGIDERILGLQEELLKTTTEKSAQSLALQRLQMGNALLKILFDEDGSISDEDRERIESLLGRKQELTAEILAHEKHCRELRDRQESIQAERRELTQQNRMLMSELKGIQAGLSARQDEGTRPELKEEVETAEGHLSIAQNVLQGLIVGSGVNWAKNPELTELLISLGERIH